MEAVRSLDRKIVFARDLSSLTGLDDEDAVAGPHLLPLGRSGVEKGPAPGRVLRVGPDVDLEYDVPVGRVVPLGEHLVVFDQNGPVRLVRKKLARVLR